MAPRRIYSLGSLSALTRGRSGRASLGAECGKRAHCCPSQNVIFLKIHAFFESWHSYIRLPANAPESLYRSLSDRELRIRQAFGQRRHGRRPVGPELVAAREITDGCGASRGIGA